jgi:hypothetical protein
MTDERACSALHQAIGRSWKQAKAGQTRPAVELLRKLDRRRTQRSAPETADTWLTELGQRAREVENGTAELEDWDAVRERLARRWRSGDQR